MVQFSLPQNSKILKGKYHKDKTGSNNLKKVNVYRWSPSSNENPRIDTFEVDLNECGPKVLDILFKIKNEIDPSLTFRRSCAHGVCGSCAMNVDGVNTLSCTKSHSDIRGDLNIYPLPHLKVVKDLVGDLMTASSSKELINTIKKISNLVESSDKVLVTMKKLEKWIIAIRVINDELLTDEVISSFDVLKSQVLVITKRKEIELKQLSDINKCQSLMMEKKKEESIQIVLN